MTTNRKEVINQSSSSKRLAFCILSVGAILILVGVIFYLIPKKIHYELVNDKEAMAVVDFQVGIKSIQNGEEYYIPRTSCIALQNMSLKFGNWFSDNSDFCDNVSGMFGTFDDNNDELVMTLYYDDHTATYHFSKPMRFIEEYRFEKGSKTSAASFLLIESKAMETIKNLRILQ